MSIAVKRPKGREAYAFISYSYLQEAHKAVLGENQRNFSNRALRVELAKSTANRPDPQAGIKRKWCACIDAGCLKGMDEARNDDAQERYLKPRTTLLRINKKEFDEAFEEISVDPWSRYSLEQITKQLPGYPSYEAGPFPDNIRQWIWASCELGGHREWIWRVFCLLYNDLFAYYEADCDTNGFWCQGSMSLYISPEPSSLITLAMTESAYSLYESQTAPAPCWSLWDADTAARRLAWAMAGHRRLGGGLLGAVGLEKDMLGMIGAMVFGEEEEEEKVERKQRRDILEEGFLRASLTP